MPRYHLNLCMILTEHISAYAWSWPSTSQLVHDLYQVHFSLAHYIKVLMGILQSTSVSSCHVHNLGQVHFDLVLYTYLPDSIGFDLETLKFIVKEKFIHFLCLFEIFSTFTCDMVDWDVRDYLVHFPSSSSRFFEEVLIKWPVLTCVSFDRDQDNFPFKSYSMSFTSLIFYNKMSKITTLIILNTLKIHEEWHKWESYKQK